jgi:hypothetical protein
LPLGVYLYKGDNPMQAYYNELSKAFNCRAELARAFRRFVFLIIEIVEKDRKAFKQHELDPEAYREQYHREGEIHELAETLASLKQKVTLEVEAIDEE